jgi:hypothetical protein
LRFSCRRGAPQKLSKKRRSRAPKAVSCKRLLGGSSVSLYNKYLFLSNKEGYSHLLCLPFSWFI